MTTFSWRGIHVLRRPRTPWLLIAAVATTTLGACSGAVQAPNLGQRTTPTTSAMPSVRATTGLLTCATLPPDNGRRDNWFGLEFACLADGAPVRGNQLRGRATVAIVWASWCGPCRRELPFVAEFARSQSAVQVIGIGWRDNPSALQAYSARTALPFITLVDRTAVIATKWNVQTQPAAVFITAQGQVAHIHRGELTSSQELQRLAQKYAR